MKTIINLMAIALLIFFIPGCKKLNTSGPWKITIDDGAEVYNYSGVTYPSADGYSAAFNSTASFGRDGNNQINSFFTQSGFEVKLGNISSINFNLSFLTSDSVIVSKLLTSNPNQVRFAALQQIVKKGIYSFPPNTTPVLPLVMYTDKKDSSWVSDYSQANFLEIVSSSPNAQDNTANGIITQVNFDLAVKGLTFSGTKRIKGTIFSFFNLN